MFPVLFSSSENLWCVVMITYLLALTPIMNSVSSVILSGSHFQNKRKYTCNLKNVISRFLSGIIKIKRDFYNNCPIYHALIDWFLSSIRRQMDKIWKPWLACAALCKWATCTHQTCLSEALFISGIWPVFGSCYCKKQIDISFLCICPLTEDCHNVVKICCGITRLWLVVPQLLWQCYNVIYHQ